MAKQAKEKGYKGERPGTKRERARKVMDQCAAKKMSRKAMIGQAVKRTGISRSTASNWASRWHGEHRA